MNVKEDDLRFLTNPREWPFPVCPLVSKLYGSRNPEFYGFVFPLETRVYFGNVYELHRSKETNWRDKAKNLPYRDFDSLSDIVRIYQLG